MDNNRTERQYMIITMNANGLRGYSYMRKFFSKHIVNMRSPDIVCVQELPGLNTRWLFEGDQICHEIPAIPAAYNIHSGVRGSMPRILVNRNCFNMLENEDLFQVVERSGEITPDELNSLRSRMCLRVAIDGDKTIIVISWHGEHRMTERRKLNKFMRLMQFGRIIRDHNQNPYPILIGGDFNLQIDVVRNYIADPFVLYEYVPSESRERVIDFFIATSDLHLFDVHFISTNGEYTIDGVHYAFMSPFDHDPIQARLEFVQPNEHFIDANVHSEYECQKCIYRHWHPNGSCQGPERGCVQCVIMQFCKWHP